MNITLAEIFKLYTDVYKDLDLDHTYRRFYKYNQLTSLQKNKYKNDITNIKSYIGRDFFTIIKISDINSQNITGYEESFWKSPILYKVNYRIYAQTLPTEIFNFFRGDFIEINGIVSGINFYEEFELNDVTFKFEIIVILKKFKKSDEYNYSFYKNRYDIINVENELENWNREIVQNKIATKQNENSTAFIVMVVLLIGLVFFIISKSQ